MAMKKEKLDRKNRGIKGRRPDKKDQRRDVAQENKEKYDKLTPIQKLAKLDHDLGEGIGAKRQRQKLQDLIEGKVVPAVETNSTEISLAKEEGKKHLKAKDRRKLQQKNNNLEEGGE